MSADQLNKINNDKLMAKSVRLSIIIVGRTPPYSKKDDIKITFCRL